LKDIFIAKEEGRKITFITGEKKTYNFLPLLENSIYAPLKILFFLKAKVVGDATAWNEDMNIVPVYKYCLKTKRLAGWCVHHKSYLLICLFTKTKYSFNCDCMH